MGWHIFFNFYITNIKKITLWQKLQDQNLLLQRRQVEARVQVEAKVLETAAEVLAIAAAEARPAKQKAENQKAAKAVHSLCWKNSFMSS
jgi:hypothetical protein